MSSLRYVKPKSDVAYFPPKRSNRRRPENNMRNLETRVKAAKGDTYNLCKFKKDKKILI